MRVITPLRVLIQGYLACGVKTQRLFIVGPAIVAQGSAILDRRPTILDINPTAIEAKSSGYQVQVLC